MSVRAARLTTQECPDRIVTNGGLLAHSQSALSPPGQPTSALNRVNARLLGIWLSEWRPEGDLCAVMRTPS